MTRGLPTHWRLVPQRYNLIGTYCKNCKNKFFPQRKICPSCRRTGSVEEFKFSGEGEIYSYTVVCVPPQGFEYQAPYVLAIVKMKEGPFITAQIVDCKPEEVEVGKKVETVFRKVIADGDSGIIKYGYKFRLRD